MNQFLYVNIFLNSISAVCVLYYTIHNKSYNKSNNCVSQKKCSDFNIENCEVTSDCWCRKKSRIKCGKCGRLLISQS
jgi:hypothetical protein